MILNPRALKSINSLEKINRECELHLMVTTGQQSTSDETKTTISYSELSSFVRHTPQNNVLIIDSDINGHIDKDRNY